jgi:hypothetical protein
MVEATSGMWTDFPGFRSFRGSDTNLASDGSWSGLQSSSVPALRQGQGSCRGHELFSG